MTTDLCQTIHFGDYVRACTKSRIAPLIEENIFVNLLNRLSYQNFCLVCENVEFFLWNPEEKICQTSFYKEGIIFQIYTKKWYFWANLHQSHNERDHLVISSLIFVEVC